MLHSRSGRLLWERIHAAAPGHGHPRPTYRAPRSPWQNGHVERLIGSIRRECIDHVVIFNEAHLRRVLTVYAEYYNRARTRLAIAKDTPLGRAKQLRGSIVSVPLMGGLHHQYIRVA